MKKTSITLRRRLLPSGKTRLYLDITSQGRRQNESLGLFLIPERTREDKQKNRETLRLAEEICAQRLIDARNRAAGFSPNTAENVLFLPFAEAFAKSRKGSTQKLYIALIEHIRRFDKRADSLTFSTIDDMWVEKFSRYLNNPFASQRNIVLKKSTRSIYLSLLTAIFHNAVSNHIILTAPTIRKPSNKTEKERMFLTIDEVRQLVDTPCKYPCLRDAFLFSCLTGLRRIDIRNLSWDDIEQVGEHTRIVFVQQKTQQREYLDITKQAADLLWKQPKTSEKVFPEIGNNMTATARLRRWVASAGITKDITFHCARHTFAVMMLDLGVDIYTVSKLLGHTDVKTTQVYAKVLDKAKQAAVDKIPDIFHNIND